MDQCPEEVPWAKRPDYVRREVTCPTRDDKQCMSVILAGAPWEGFRVYGPFATSEEAGDYQAKHLYAEDFWWIVPMRREV